ncbi:histidine--tRNA ligase [Papillibacter cinnamivorans]|uniref:Histidine--tRNA ligase n=1 Tax=Papillibacter cinnamivorans DSM 12816 TaxID=1122930 RepID=A0A1W2A9P0_9FIRM|nr:histidine--tRNA ligase [Papillibacter cinnamivorans]SMC57131.1 histidyl-tRNA synthetase [Papillibacter cinnamivorans DSM 12816]
MSLITAPRGTKDVLPSESYKWHYVEGILRKTAADFGYSEIRFPTFENTDLFIRGVGDTTDVVQKEMYTFLDKGGRSISLRPEGTASVVRSFLEHSLYSAGLPVKAYYIAPNFRYEKPQAGRLREHHQFGVECFGAACASADAEVIGLADTYLSRLGIRGISLEINSIGCPYCRPKYHEALKEYFKSREDSLCPTCLDRLERNPLRILDCKNESCKIVSAGAPVMLDYLCDDCREHFNQLQGYLKAMGISYAVNPRIVRGLDYYTRTVFEFVSTEIGAQGTVCGGGRYDGFVSALGGPPTPGLGFGSGIERLLLVMEAQGIDIPRPAGIRVFIAAIGDAADLRAQQLVHSLRRIGIPAERDTAGRGLKAQMKFSDRIGALYTIVLGDDELSSGSVRVKNMATGEESPCRLDTEAIADFFRYSSDCSSTIF